MRKSVVNELKETLKENLSEEDNVISEISNKIGFQKLLACVKKLQHIVASVSHSSGKNFSLNLPRIVAVGSQSVGKSSVIEGLMGCSILPRGEGIVTRCPLVINLEQIPEGEETTVSFDHTTEKFTDFVKAREEIKLETERRAPEAQLSKDPIFLKVSSSNVVNLTIVDLPGITKVPIRNQPENVEAQVLELINEYVKETNTIILAVSAANADLAVSDALKIARAVDPKGYRTIGVITKCDLVDQESVLVNIIQNEIYSLSKGYVGVFCPPVEEEDGLDHEKLRKLEDLFFKRMSDYNLIRNRCGIKQLSLILNEILISHVKETLPTIRKQLVEKRLNLNAELQSYGLETGNLTPLQKKTKAFEKLMSYCKKYEGLLSGALYSSVDKSLSGGARVLHIFDRVLNDLCGCCMVDYDEKRIRLAIRNFSGVKPKIFPAELVVESLIKESIETLRAPGLRCVDFVYQELMGFHETCLELEAGRLPNLERLIRKVSYRELKELIQPTKKMIENLVDVELAYLNIVTVCGSEICLQRSYNEGEVKSKIHYTQKGNDQKINLESYKSLSKLPKELDIPEETSPDEINQLKMIKKITKDYYDRVRGNIMHYIPRVIMHFMVYETTQTLNLKLIEELEDTDIDYLLSPTETVAELRKSCALRVEAVKEAEILLDKLFFENEE